VTTIPFFVAEQCCPSGGNDVDWKGDFTRCCAVRIRQHHLCIHDDPWKLRSSHGYDSNNGVDRYEYLLLALVCSRADCRQRNNQILAVWVMKGEVPPDLWEQQTGDVLAVKPDDLKKVWRLFGGIEARNPGQSGAAGDNVYKSVCSPGADARSVWYRASMLALTIKMRSDLLARWIRDGQPDDAVFEVAATFPMVKMRTGIVREGLPFDVEEFVKRIG
jgi:hypothetical protein